MSSSSFWALFGVVALQIIIFSFWLGKLTQRVDHQSKGNCPLHGQLNENLIRLEERANMAKEIAIAVAVAKKEWDSKKE